MCRQLVRDLNFFHRTLIVQALPDLRSLDGEIFSGGGKVRQTAYITSVISTVI